MSQVHPAKYRRGLKRLLCGVALSLSFFAANPIIAHAAGGADDDEVTTDGRLEGYEGQPVAIKESGTGGTWIVFLLMAVGGCLVLFKNAKRA